MTDREAIEYAEKELQNTGYALETNSKLRGGLFKILSTKFDFLVRAKCALKERDERSKGCDFCCYQEYPDSTLYPKESNLFYAGYCKRVKVDEFEEDEIDSIDFCPKCGRPLKGADNG